MKKIGILFIVFFVANTLIGQNLTVGSLIELSKKSLGEVEEDLTSKNWYFFQGRDEKKSVSGFFQSKEEEKSVFGTASFVFDVPNLNEGVLAKYFITYYYSVQKSANIVEFTHRNKKIYENFCEQIDNLDFRLFSSYTENGNIIKVYSQGGSIVEITIPPNFEKENSYKFLFARKSSYKRYKY